MAKAWAYFCVNVICIGGVGEFGNNCYGYLTLLKSLATPTQAAHLTIHQVFRSQSAR